MSSSEIKDYMDYWMEEEGFSELLESDSRVVEDVSYYGEGLPRAVISFNDGLLILFPEFNPQFNYIKN